MMAQTVDNEALERAVEHASRDLPAVLAVYLFGSARDGTMRPDSDVDLAVLLEPSTQALRRLDIRTTLASRLEAVVRRRVQVVALAEADPILAFHALSGRLLLDRDPVERSLATVRMINRYEDERFTIEQFYRPALAARALRGTFGRP